MLEVKAKLNNYRQSPRKVRLVADTVRGKSVEEAITTLSFTLKRSALPLQKLLASALANAKDLSVPTENLVVKEIKVDAGSTLYRRRPRSKGMSNPIRKRTSHISVILAESKARTKKLVPST
ncbi:MAG: 50S ribosomal protein L22 [bacterium]|nr:50S ribosomal protein L22 [bacterium]MDZ4205737.1 50S ribosomal protein L22 [Patescibacteria group bacterium]